MKDIGKMTITEAYEYIKPIADVYGLRLNRLRDFKLARMILVNLYSRELA